MNKEEEKTKGPEQVEDLGNKERVTWVEDGEIYIKERFKPMVAHKRSDPLPDRFFEVDSLDMPCEVEGDKDNNI